MGANLSMFKSSSSAITDSGEFLTLRYEIYSKWGTIHLIETNGVKKDIVFKKDCKVFEEKLEEIDFDSMCDGDTAKIEGSGNNADLIITVRDGDISVHLENKKMPGFIKIMDILKKSKKKVATKL